MRFVWFFIGILVCAYKGAKLPFLYIIPGVQNKEDLLDRWFGITDPRLDYVIDNLKAEPWRWMHHTTDLVVEWARLRPQVTAKVFCAAIAIPWVIHWVL